MSSDGAPAAGGAEAIHEEEAVDYGEDAAGGREEGSPSLAAATAADTEIAELQQMLDEMEQNQTKIAEASTAAVAQASSAVAAKGKADEEKQARDERSVFVGNVDFAATGEELMGYFSSCGTIERVTILADRHGQPKGCVRGGRSPPLMEGPGAGAAGGSTVRIIAVVGTGAVGAAHGR